MAAAALFVGPFYGEFGHELGFAAMARALAQAPVVAEAPRLLRERRPAKQAGDYSRVIVCTRPARHALYADFADEFRPHDIQCEGVIATATAATRPDGKLLRRYVPSDAEQFGPREYRSGMEVAWHKYGHSRKHYADAVVIHARSRPHCPERNWSQRNWNKLARRMFREGIAKRIICLGMRGDALAVEGALDMRDATLDVQMDVLASARFAVGPSSGPMHLGQLCGCPVLVWCGGPEGERNRTSRRYVKDWNPFKALAHAHLVGSWQPTIETVWDWLTAFVAKV